MRTRNTELGDLLGEQYMKTKYKVVAQESAYMYQNLAWGQLVRILDKEELKRPAAKQRAPEKHGKRENGWLFEGFG